MRLWLRFALRDLRSGLQGFWIFLACLALGTAAIAVVGSLAAAIDRGLTEQGQPLLGGDIEFSLIHREASADELAWLNRKGEVGVTATLRAMAQSNGAATLVEAKAVDQAYPLYGSLALEGGGDFRAAIAPRGSAWGAVADPLLFARLGLKPGDHVKIGGADIVLAGTIAQEPDRVSDGFFLGPRLLMSRTALAATGLIQPGSLITWHYRLKLPKGATLAELRATLTEADKRFPAAGWQTHTRNNAAPGIDRFIQRIGSFMTLVGLAALIVGGTGIANAVTAFVGRRTSSIATLKCLGAVNRDVFGIYLTEILLVGVLAIAIGLAAGAAAPTLAARLLGGILPLPVSAAIEAVPLVVAGVLGFLATIAFAVWPLSRTRRASAAGLFRHRTLPHSGRPAWTDLLAIAASFAGIAGVALASLSEPRITGWFLAGLIVAFVVLIGLARLIVVAARRLPPPRSAIWRHAIANVHRPGSAAASVILALGLGLSLFVTLALTDRTLSAELRSGIPDRAPAFFFLDVKAAELDSFMAAVKAEPGVTEVSSAPMMRGRIVKVKDVPAEKVEASPDSAWALRGDRGLTYSQELPAGSRLSAGKWWPKDYEGPPLVSLVGDVARGLGLAVGDPITVNVLGREVTATVASFREVNWRSLGINFLMVFTPATLAAAPHANIVTVTMAGGDEAKLVNDMARRFPGVTAVRVKDAIGLVADLLAKMLTAIRGANVMTLMTGVLVLAGALAAGLSERLYEAVVLKTYGATRGQLIGAFVIEYSCLGAAAAIFGLLVGSLASWFLARFILEMPWSFDLATAALTAAIAMALAIVAGLATTWSALSARPARYLRDE
ncbi:MAG: FtsX-like permease family protein [Rhizobiales bacterium]|nr:FtsX-like permease family protein [Hyphomicrobiales bacterium]MBI3673172.1 FtsX-like permease family protein [Hyphomicrobiales bacterium]